MPELPSGTVTFLLTDIEGSTRLLADLGEAYADALAEHRRLLRDAFAAQGGVEVDTQGDAFFYAFADARAAVEAAAAAQAALTEGPVRVRMGVHTGDPILTDEGYVGLDVHLGARIAAAGHGGQVLLSQATRSAIEPSTRPVLDLGEHRLKDFDEPVWIYQLGEGSFPPLKTISNTNLPRPASSFVGRERERAEIVSLVRERARLVTLTGPGGSGKTRLAIEAAAELVPAFGSGVFWVGLAPLRDPGLVLETIGQVLGARDGLAEHIGERELLLLLDNLEQVVEAAPGLASLVEACPNLRLLVTSRELMRVRGEVEYPVVPLAEPDAVELFCERARVDRDEMVSELCRRLDNLPLAVELAAARARALSPAQILQRLSERLDLLKGGRDADPRQQTLRATIEWSYDLLDEEERMLFARMAVFAGGCTLEAAAEVCDADVDILQSLVQKSLLRWTAERFWMLETIRQFAGQMLSGSGEEVELRDRHAAWVGDVAEAGFIPFYGHTSDEWLTRIERELENLRAALEWVEATGRDAELGRLCALAFNYWFVRGLLREAERWLETAVRREGVPSEWRGRLLVHAFNLAMQQRDLPRAKALADEEIAFFRGLGTPLGEVTALRDAGMVALASGELDRAAALCDEAAELGRTIDYADQAVVEVNRALVEIMRRDWIRAEELARVALATAAELGDEGIAVTCRVVLAFALLGQECYEEARTLLLEAFDGALARRRTVVADVLDGLAEVLSSRGDHRHAAQLLGRADEVRREVGVPSEDDAADWTRERTIGRVRGALGPAAYKEALADGAQLSLEVARDLAASA